MSLKRNNISLYVITSLFSVKAGKSSIIQNSLSANQSIGKYATLTSFTALLFDNPTSLL